MDYTIQLKRLNFRLEKILKSLSNEKHLESAELQKIGNKIVAGAHKLWAKAKDASGGLEKLLKEFAAKITSLISGEKSKHLESSEDKKTQRFLMKVMEQVGKLTPNTALIILVIIISTGFFAALYVIGKAYKVIKGKSLIEAVMGILTGGFNKIKDKFLKLFEDIKNVRGPLDFFKVLFKSVFAFFMVPFDFLIGTREAIERAQFQSFIMEVSAIGIVSFGLLALVISMSLSLFEGGAQNV